ncbi:MvdD family ATP-grasp ribosomal peptide maturase [bacterium]|nr:MvdD family ATP-grasp ribosomal peptide maturase [bacterium]
MKVLLVTRSDDNDSVAMVSQAIHDLGGTPYRLDTDHYPTSVRLTTQLTRQRTLRQLNLPAGWLDLDEVASLWYRRFFAGARIPEELGDTREPCVNEARRTLYGTIAGLDVLQVDPLSSVRRTDHKELQLMKAREFGLTIPKTLFSNDPIEVRRFFRELDGQMVTKMQSSFAIYRGQDELVVFTTPVKAQDLEDLSGLRYAPMTFQEWIPKACELRSTVVGKKVFTARVLSQKSEVTAVDWRRDGVGLIEEWEPQTLPAEVEAGLLRLTEFFGLNYAGADFVVAPDGTHYFLEINAGGEWFWLQRCLPIAEAMAELLMLRSGRVKTQV